MLCFACGSSPNILHEIGKHKWLFCEKHADELKNHFLLKCKTCGSWGYIPITPKSIIYLAESKMEDNIAMVNYCPNCMN